MGRIMILLKILFDECEEEFKCSSLQMKRHGISSKIIVGGRWKREYISDRKLVMNYGIHIIKNFKNIIKNGLKREIKVIKQNIKVKSDQVVKIMKNLKSTPFKIKCHEGINGGIL